MNRKCWTCGKSATTGGTKVVHICGHSSTGGRFVDTVESESIRAYCEECYKSSQSEMEEAKREYIRLKAVLMLERAIKLLERQELIIDEYNEAIKAVEEFFLENPEKFSSSHEIIAAIILIDNEIKISTQKKIGKYIVDFYIESLKIVLEIDGFMHENRLFYDNQRDIFLRNELGKEWEVVRIKTEYLEQNAPMLVEAIKAVKAEKQKLRAENYGQLPEWYSSREKPKKKKQQKYGDELLL